MLKRSALCLLTVNIVGEARHLGRFYSDGSEAPQTCRWVPHRDRRARKGRRSWSNFTVRLSRSNYGCAD
jgi:hypothetical protein